MSNWKSIDSAPTGYDGKTFHHVLFRGRSKAGSFSGFAYVSGWMDHNRQPVHDYSYKLVIDAWMDLPA